MLRDSDGSNTSEQQNGLCGGLCRLNQRWWRDIEGGREEGKAGEGVYSGPVCFFPYSFLFSLCAFVFLSSTGTQGDGGKFSFCQFAEKKNIEVYTGRKLAISWKSKLPSAAATGASYFQKMALALPSSIMYSGIQNRNKEMALMNQKAAPFVVYVWILTLGFNFLDSVSSPTWGIASMRFPSYATHRTFIFRSDLRCVMNMTRPIRLWIKNYQ